MSKNTSKRVRGSMLGGGGGRALRGAIVLGGGVGFGMNTILRNRRSPTLKKAF